MNAQLPPVAVIDLVRPITSGAGSISTLQVRQPTLGDLLDLGSLHRVIVSDLASEQPACCATWDADRAVAWLERLTGLGRDCLRQMSAGDFARAREVVTGASIELDREIVRRICG